MGFAVCIFILSAIICIPLDFMLPGLGTTAAVIIIGSFIIYSLNRDK